MLRDLMEFVIFIAEAQENLIENTKALRKGIIEDADSDAAPGENLFDNDQLWEKYFGKILEGKWSLRDNPNTIVDYGLALAGFYKKAHSDKTVPTEQILSLMFYVDELVRDFFQFGALYIATTEPTGKKLLAQHKRQVSRNQTKTESDWKPILVLIEEFHSKGIYDDCKTFESLVDTTYTHLFSLNQQKPEGEKKLHQYSRDTIRRMFKQVFNITPDNYKQPLELLSNFDTC